MALHFHLQTGSSPASRCAAKTPLAALPLAMSDSSVGTLIMVWSCGPDGRPACRWVDPDTLVTRPSLRLVRTNHDECDPDPMSA